MKIKCYQAAGLLVAALSITGATVVQADVVKSENIAMASETMIWMQDISSVDYIFASNMAAMDNDDISTYVNAEGTAADNDEVSAIFAATRIPLPASVWLLCSGFVGLVCVARREPVA